MWIFELFKDIAFDIVGKEIPREKAARDSRANYNAWLTKRSEWLKENTRKVREEYTGG